MAGPSGATSSLVNNFAATAAPTVNDDASAGYTTGSSWMIPGTGEMWRCRSALIGLARWVKIDVADHPGYVAGRFYTPFGQGAPIVGSNFPAGTAFLVFGVIKQRITISQLQAKVTTVSSGGNFQLAIYNHDPVSGKASTLVASTAAGSTGTAANVNVALSGGNVTLEPGNYWFAGSMDNATAVLFAVGPSSFNHLASVGTASGLGVNATTQPCAISVAVTYGSWPSDLSGVTQNEVAVARAPAIMFLVASVP